MLTEEKLFYFIIISMYQKPDQNLEYTKANPWTKWLVISLSQWSTMPSPRPVYVAYVVDKLAPGQVYLKIFLLSCVIPSKEHMIWYQERIPAEWKFHIANF